MFMNHVIIWYVFVITSHGLSLSFNHYLYILV